MRPVILHVEDNSDLVETVKIGFVHLGFQGQFLSAGNVSDALYIIRNRREQNLPLELLIVDMNLPDGTGHDVIRQVKSNPNWSSTPILVLSNETDNETVAEAYALGANCYFPKLAEGVSVFDAMEALYICWFDLALLPKARQGSINGEILGRSVSLKSQIAEFYTRLARQFSDDMNKSKLWLDLAINESNHANLLAFFEHSLDDTGLAPESLEKLKAFIAAKESNFHAAQVHSMSITNPTMEDGLRWALRIEAGFDPDIFAIAAGQLFPNGPAATIALKDSTINRLNRLVAACRESTDPQIRMDAASLAKRVAVVRVQESKVAG
jgi:CheY-like chemotaxis protein